jgi:hypothetical protein
MGASVFFSVFPAHWMEHGCLGFLFLGFLIRAQLSKLSPGFIQLSKLSPGFIHLKLKAVADFEFELVHFDFELLGWVKGISAGDRLARGVHQ